METFAQSLLTFREVNEEALRTIAHLLLPVEEMDNLSKNSIWPLPLLHILLFDAFLLL